MRSMLRDCPPKPSAPGAGGAGPVAPAAALGDEPGGGFDVGGGVVGSAFGIAGEIELAGGMVPGAAEELEEACGARAGFLA